MLFVCFSLVVQKLESMPSVFFVGALGSIHESNKNERKVDYYKQRNHTSAQARERVF